jgi:hypothetical protein
METSVTRLTMVIGAALIILLFLAVVIVKLLLDLYAEEPLSSESRQPDRRQDFNQRPVKPESSLRTDVGKRRRRLQSPSTDRC